MPAVVTGSGFGGVKEMLLAVFGEALARAGVATLAVDVVRRLFGLPSRRVAVAGAPHSDAVMTSDGALAWIREMSANAPTFRRNQITVRSLARLAPYRPMRRAGRRGIKVPLRAILSTSDSITRAALARKELRDVTQDVVELSGSHFELFGEHLNEAVSLTVEWFVRHLSVSATPAAFRVRSTQ